MAKLTRYVRACRQIEAAIAHHTRAGSGAKQTRAAMQRDLARWAATNYAGGDYDRLLRLRKLPWKQWDRELYVPGLFVACALRLMARDGYSQAQALRFTEGAAADVDEALALIKRAGLNINDVVAQQSPDIDTILALNRERLHVQLEARALEDILLAAAEGYKVSPGKGFRYTEVFGLCFGNVRRTPGREDGQDLFVSVSRVATQMRAKATASQVMPNSKSLAAHLDVSDRFFPHLEVVGDYHTHTFKTFGDLIAAKGWEYSPSDERAVPGFVDEVRERHNRPLFSLVVAVAEGGKNRKGPYRRRSNVVQVPVGGLYFVVGAYRILLDSTYDDEVDLRLPALIG